MRDVLPPDHLARFIVAVVAQLDLGIMYRKYSERSAPPYAPEVMLGLLFCRYASRRIQFAKIERATHEVIPFRFITGDSTPTLETLGFRQQFSG
ncbi:MAG: transposase [Chloroflexi bacterium]|nr:transposase [Chloroflexota bacterium]